MVQREYFRPASTGTVIDCYDLIEKVKDNGK